ncbi:MAG: hypothetical protein ACM3ZV_07400 [Bacillota bacterium]
MERRVIFQDGMDNDPADYNHLQDFTEQSLDHIVGDAITADRKFAGFASAATGVTTLTVAPGRLYVNGQVYNSDTEFVKDFAAQLPVATRRIAMVVAFGDEVDTDGRPREFLIDEETGNSEPRVVSMERARVAKISVAMGQESADPLPPLLDAGVTAIATIVLAATGIESVTMTAENAIDSVQSVANRVEDLETFRDRANPQIASLASDIAALTAGQANLVGNVPYGRTLERLATLESKAGIPDAAADSYADFLLDDTGSDLGFAGSSAKIEEGVRFADEASAVTQLALLNPLDPKAKVVGGMLLPAYTSTLRMTSGPKSGEIQAASFTYGENAVVQKTVSRHRVRHGRAKTPSSAANWWKTGRFDAAALIFRREDEVWTIPANRREQAIKHHVFDRHKFHFEDSYEETYWEAVTTPAVVNGTIVAETWLQGNDTWLISLGLEFTKLAAAGGVTVLICETDRGMPLLDKVISSTTLNREDLVLNAETQFPLQPAFLTGGKRYAAAVITAADHWLAATSSFQQGTLFYVQDGAYQQGDPAKDLKFSLYSADFTAAQAVIDLQPLQLAGGLSDVDILASAVIPGSTQLSYRIQVGGAWYPLGDVDDTILGAGGVMPAMVPLQAVFTGTPDVMPAVRIDSSQAKVSRSKPGFTYVTAIRNLPGAGSAQIRATFLLEQFDEVHHDLTVSLLSGAGYATETAATSVTDVAQPDGSIERTVVFNLGAAVTSYRFKAVGATDSQLLPFHIAARKDYAL